MTHLAPPPTLPALLARIGWTYREMARRMDVAENTAHRWKHAPPRAVVAWLSQIAEAIDTLPPPERGWRW